ncbi:hypothetical protein EYF80_005061 [Liparis tanakae]|uniref:Uncharacterized protein n=1 Tax=Liparis tanakae TaxID=230148 RepID=A0A4Z2J377_9TELE|nr:hypothetical protein EYF80_005061 [Liparis tanakae]
MLGRFILYAFDKLISRESVGREPQLGHQHALWLMPPIFFPASHPYRLVQPLLPPMCMEGLRHNGPLDTDDKLSTLTSLTGSGAAAAGWCFCTILIPPALTATDTERHIHTVYRKNWNN